MAKKARRTMSARVVLTQSAYKAIEDSAFKNCRTVSQELSYRIERQIAGSAPIQTMTVAAVDKYDDPVAIPEPTNDGCAIPPQSSGNWTEAQESEWAALGQGSGKSEGQMMALRIIHKTFEAAKVALEADKATA